MGIVSKTNPFSTAANDTLAVAPSVAVSSPDYDEGDGGDGSMALTVAHIPGQHSFRDDSEYDSDDDEVRSSCVLFTQRESGRSERQEKENQKR
jgi:hypothetical protein